jgi:hypothetical protein
MTPPKAGGPDSQAALDAYRAFAHAEADALFDERALDAQRRRLLDRLAHLGQTARVIPFPAALHPPLPASGVNRRWVSVAAAAGLIIGLVSGQFVHFFAPALGVRAGRVEAPAMSAPPRPAVDPRPAVAAAEDDGLLGEVDSMVQLRTAAELRVLDELTPLHDPR